MENILTKLKDLEYSLHFTESKTYPALYKFNGMSKGILFFKTNYNDISQLIFELIAKTNLLNYADIIEKKFLDRTFVIVKFHNKTLETMYKLKHE